MFEHLPKTRAEAKKSSESFYFTGEPCLNGHVDRRRTYNHTCCECARSVYGVASGTKFLNKKRQKTKKRLRHPKAIPQWADLEVIDDMMLEAKESGLVLDHIIPLRGKAREGISVCGLHCEANLQPITYGENDRKGYHRWPDMWNPDLQNNPPKPKPYKWPVYKPIDKSVMTYVSKDKRRNVFEISLKGDYIGETKDLFEAYCMKRSAENYYEMLIYVSFLNIFANELIGQQQPISR